MFRKKTFFIVMFLAVMAGGFLFAAKTVNASATGCSCYYGDGKAAGTGANNIDAPNASTCNKICDGITGGAGGWYDYKNGSYAKIIHECASKGVDYLCVTPIAISSPGSCASDVVCPSASLGVRCCPASAISFSAGSATGAGTVCSGGNYCKNTVGVDSSALSSCGTTPCATQTYINGRCCPLITPTATTPTQNISGITNDYIPGTTEGDGIVKCGRPGQKMCTLCDLIKGMNNVVQYLMKIAIGIALLAVAIGGVMYIVSAGDSGLMDMAKKTMQNAAIGFVIIFAGYLIVNTTIMYLGATETLGMKVNTTWGNFECDTTTR